MRRLLAFVLVAAAFLVPVVALADESVATGLPFVVAFACPVGDPAAPSDPETVAAVVEQLRKTGKADVLAFDPELPAVLRAVMERRLEQGLVDRASDPQNAVRLASGLGAQYALLVEGSVAGSRVHVKLELLKVPGGGRWSATAATEVAAGGGPRAAINRSNAIATAAGSAASQIAIVAFAQGPAEPGAPPGDVSVTVPPVTTTPGETVGPRDTAAQYAEFMKQADAYLAERDLANAAMALRRAIDLAPDEIAPRLKLADTYSEMGMGAEAIDECKRALLFNSETMALYSLLANLHLQNGALAEAAAQCLRMTELDPRNLEARLTLGDLYWNQGKIDEAATAYQEAMESAPENPAPHERLQRLYLARKMYSRALDHSLRAGLLTAGAGENDQARYRVVAQLVRDEFNAVLDALKTAGVDLAETRISRADYYQECKDAAGRTDALASFLSTQTSPSDQKNAHSHCVLGVSLLAQATGYMVSYLETEKSYYMDQARLLQAEAETEMRLFANAVPKV